MKVSSIGLRNVKISETDEQFPVQDMLIKTGQIEQYGSGIYAFGHIPYLVKKNLDKVICDVLTSYGLAEVSLPLLQPESIWMESGRLDNYVKDDVMFRCETSKGNFCLAPTAEEAVVMFASSRLTSYKQLPVTYFQIGAKFRNELRSRGFLLRGKSFDMMDAYSFGRNEEDLKKEYANIKNAYFEIFNKIGLEVQAVGADNGDFGGSMSEEFMFLSDIGEDNILFDKESNKAFNSEILERSDYKEYLEKEYGIKNTDNLIKRKAVELGHIFQLGDKYSKALNKTFVDSDGIQKNYVMGCYGIGVSRTLAMVYENSIIKENNKFKGISLPILLCPYYLYIIPKLDDDTKSTLAEEIYKKLIKENIKVLYDDRLDLTIGAKINDAKMTGVPYVVVFGNTLDNGYVDVECIKDGKKVSLKPDEILDNFKNIDKINKLFL